MFDNAGKVNSAAASISSAIVWFFFIILANLNQRLHVHLPLKKS